MVLYLRRSSYDLVDVKTSEPLLYAVVRGSSANSRMVDSCIVVALCLILQHLHLVQFIHTILASLAELMFGWMEAAHVQGPNQ